MLRAAVKAGTPLGLAAKKVMDSGALVSDDIIIGLVKERLAQPDCAKGFLFDGFPRTIPQADAMKNAGVQARLRAGDRRALRGDRRAHERPPLAPGLGPHLPRQVQPAQGGRQGRRHRRAAVQRDDDKEETVQKRLDVYAAQTRPLVEYYSNWAKPIRNAPKYRRIDGMGTVDEITARALQALADCGRSPRRSVHQLEDQRDPRLHRRQPHGRQPVPRGRNDQPFGATRAALHHHALLLRLQ
jgi:adenylate kinase